MVKELVETVEAVTVKAGEVLPPSSGPLVLVTLNPFVPGTPTMVASAAQVAEGEDQVTRGVASATTLLPVQVHT